MYIDATDEHIQSFSIHDMIKNFKNALYYTWIIYKQSITMFYNPLKWVINIDNDTSSRRYLYIFTDMNFVERITTFNENQVPKLFINMIEEIHM